MSDRNNSETRLNSIYETNCLRPVDFKSQLQQWLDTEAAATDGLFEEAVRSRPDHTVISEARLQRNYAVSKLVERRIATVIGQLDMSARRGTKVPKLILTQTGDVTFLPEFKSAGGRYKDSVGILEGWDGKPPRGG
ncbi:Esterase SGNH hydrolase-type [Penicillium viridicatum]|nr:Esterase SGNH hydrolase-type [Penicillium viridicatum]